MKTLDMPTRVVSASGPPSLTDAPPSISESRLARWDMVSGIKKRWADGEKANALAVLLEHPDLTQDPSIVLDLAYVEFWTRRQAGEKIDPQTFADRFPKHRDELERMLGIKKFLDDNPDLLKDAPRNWPNVGDNYLGFSLLRELGKGGFARVFLAKEKALGDRQVAVKVSRGGTAEAETLGRIEHPNIVPVHSVRLDPATGLTIVCMPYLGEATLVNVLKHVYPKAHSRPPQSPHSLLQAIEVEGASETLPDAAFSEGTYIEALVNIGLGLARGLTFMHERGIYHRDMKPANVLMGPNGVPRILDFNLARDDERATPGEVGGTPTFMAPEQLVAMPGGKEALAEIGPRADLFSFGVILYQLLTGEHPFGPLDGMNELEARQYLLNRHRQPARPLAQFNSDVDRDLNRLLHQCLSVDPEARPESAQVVAAELERIAVRMKRSRERIARMPRLIRNGVLVAVAVTALAGAGGVLAAHLFMPNPDALQALGDDATSNGDYQAAVDRYTEAINAGLASPEIYISRAKAYFKLGGKHRELQQQCAARHRGDPNNMEVEGHRIDADTAFQNAIQDFKELDPNGIQGWAQIEIGRCYAEIKQFRTASDHFEKAETLGANEPAMFVELARCYTALSKRDNKYQQSLKAQKPWQRVLEQDPGHPEALLGRARFALQYEADKADFDPTDYLIMVESGLKARQNLPAEIYLDAACLYCSLATRLANEDKTMQAVDRAGVIVRGLGSAWPGFSNLLARAKDPSAMTADQCLAKAMQNILIAEGKGINLGTLKMDKKLEPLHAYPDFQAHLAAHNAKGTVPVRLEGVEEAKHKASD